MQNIEVGANMGLLLHDRKDKPNGVVVCLATSTWGVFESWGDDIPVSESDPSVPRLRFKLLFKILHSS